MGASNRSIWPVRFETDVPSHSQRAIRPWTSPPQGENYTSNLECGTRRIVFASPSDVDPDEAGCIPMSIPCGCPRYVGSFRQGKPTQGFGPPRPELRSQIDPIERAPAIYPGVLSWGARSLAGIAEDDLGLLAPTVCDRWPQDRMTGAARRWRGARFLENPGLKWIRHELRTILKSACVLAEKHTVQRRRVDHGDLLCNRYHPASPSGESLPRHESGAMWVHRSAYRTGSLMTV